MTCANRSPYSFAIFLFMLFEAGPAYPGDDLIEALKGGKVDLYVRYRMEYVDDSQPRVIGGKLSNIPLKDGFANTVRLALGYSTGLFYDFGAYAQFQYVGVLDDHAYNDGGSNGVVDRAQVIDPGGARLQQGNLRYVGIPYTTLRLGRQEIEHRKAPFHRYVGNILWRQQWQNFDAFRVLNESLPATVIDYSYAWEVNRIFGDGNPVPDRSHAQMNSHLIRAVYSGFPYGSVETYAYLLDFDNPVSEGFSTSTLGLRFEGSYDLLSYPMSIQYTAEYANQMDFGDNPVDINVNYWLGELGATYNFVDSPLESVGLKASIEVLEGRGNQTVKGCCGGTVARAFQTPLGTNHAFQGWADRFLVTPGDGIEDFHLTLSMKVYGCTLAGVWYHFMANNADYNYGNEYDVLLERPIANNFLVGLKYAYYDASGNATNFARNSKGFSGVGAQAFDLEKFWAYVQYKF